MPYSTEVKQLRYTRLLSVILACLGCWATMVYSQEVVTEKAETPPQELPQQPPQQETSESALSAEEARQAQEDAANCKNYVQIQQDVSLKKTSRIDNQLFNGLEGKTIRNILFKTVDVFDEENPKENNRLYLFLNDLHFNTRAYVVESQLLFHVGEPLNVKNIHESERILRTRDYLTNAYVVPVVVCDDQVDLLVVTQDSWALEPRVSFSHKSGDNETGFGISDGNILGSGNALTIIYSENEQRNGVGYDFSNPHFLNREIDFRVYYEDTNDGRNSIINVSRPFYSLETPWATGIKLEDTSLIENIRSRGETINEFRHQTLLHEFFIGKATDVSSNYTQRWLLGLSHEEETFYPTPETVQAIPDEDKATYPWIEYQYHDNKFGVYKNVNQIQRPEDMALGRNFSFRLGVGGTTFDNPDDVVRYRSAYTHIMDIRDIHIFEYSVKIDGRQHLQIDGLDPVILSTSMSYNYFIDEKNRWYSRVSYDVGQDLAQQQELTVGGMTGLRGYPSDYFRGKKRYVFTLERRYFSDIHLFSLLRMGAVVYFDMGKAWGLDSDPYSPLLSDVGIGLRFASTKVRIGNVIHVDVAMPTSARSGISEYQLTIGAQKQF